MSRGLRWDENAYRTIFARMNRAYPSATPIAKDTAILALTVARKSSSAEMLLAQQMTMLDFPVWERNYRFALPQRKHELDFAWLEKKIGCEVQGGVHRIKDKFARDTEKMFLEHLHGWRVIRATKEDIQSGRAVAWLTTLMGLA